MADNRIPIPIQDVRLPGNRQPQWRGLVVVIGPNSSGKTQLLRDINATVCGEARDLVVAQSVTLAPIADVSEYVDVLVERGDLRRDFDEQGNPTIQRRSGQHGTDTMGRGSALALSTFENRYRNQFVPKSGEPIEGRIPADAFLADIGGLVCTTLFLHNRLTAANQTDNFDYETAPPSNTIQSLYVDQQAQAMLTTEIIGTFQRALWLDNTRGGRLCFRVATTSTIPTDAELRQPEEMRKHRLLDDEGDGMRSYVATCMALLLGQRPLCIIDEPELCLHPPQAYAIGRFIGRYGRSDERCTVVATHSSYILRGIIAVHPNVQVIRLVRAGENFASRVLDSGALIDAIDKPLSRSESILDGLLSDGVILCESEGDRIVYEAVVRALVTTRDIRVVSATSGVGAMSAICRLYRTLGVPVAVVADIDLICKENELSAILQELGLAGTELSQCRDASRTIAACVPNPPNELTPGEVAERCDALALALRTPNDCGAMDVRTELLRLAAHFARFRELKRRGRAALTVDQRDLFDRVDILQRATGLFLVPVGELERWVADLNIRSASKQGKAKWALDAAAAIESSPVRDNDVWGFIQQVLSYLDQQVALAVEEAHAPAGTTISTSVAIG